jgi:YidC/Oxa1 family membrane protein insertase
MEARNILVATLASMTVFFIWMFIVAPRLGFTPPLPNTTQPTTSTAPRSGPAPAGSPSIIATTGPSVVTTVPAGPHPDAIFATAEETVTLGSDEPDGPYEFAIDFTNRGAGIRAVRLANHADDVDLKNPYPILHLYDSWATAQLVLNGEKHELANVFWRQEPVGANPVGQEPSVTYTTTVPNSDTPRVKLIKTYTLHPTDPDRKNKNRLQRFDVTVVLAVENLSSESIEVVITQRGPMGMLKEDPRSDLRMALGAVRTGEDVSIQDKATHDQVVETQSKDLAAEGDGATFMWASIENKFFACFATPLPPADETGPRFVSARAITLTGATDNETDDDLGVELVSSLITLPANGKTEVALQAFFGPKLRMVFESETYQAHHYEAVIDYAVTWCTFQWLVRLMVWLLYTLHSLVRNYGLAIIILVLIVRTLLHPVTKKSQVNMMRMQKSMATVQPKVEEIKNRYPNDANKRNTEMMALYREEGINPAGNILGCLPMMLQMPIWVALWTSLSSTVEMRHAPLFVEGYWIKDLTRPDHLIAFSNNVEIPLISSLTGPISGLHLLPFLLGISMHLNQRFMSKLSQPASGEMTDQQKQQQKMMKFMSVFFVVFLYNAPAGLNLYIMASTFFGLIEQMRIRKHIRDEEEKGALLPPKPKPGGGKRTGFMARLQKAAEEAQRIESAKKKQSPRKKPKP